MKKETAKTTRGTLIFIMGIILGLLYIFKVYPFEYTTPVGKALLTVWACLGGLISLITIGSGLSIIYLDEDEKSFYEEE